MRANGREGTWLQAGKGYAIGMRNSFYGMFNNSPIGESVSFFSGKPMIAPMAVPAESKSGAALHEFMGAAIGVVAVPAKMMPKGAGVVPMGRAGERVVGGANRLGPTVGVLEDGAFAQVPAKSTKAFSEEGQKIYSQAAGRPIQTVNDLADALKQGVVKPSQVPLDYVVIDGQKITANTRSSTALINAEIPKTQWFGVDKSGVKAYGDVTFDDLVRNQLNKNYGGSVQKARR